MLKRSPFSSQSIPLGSEETTLEKKEESDKDGVGSSLKGFMNAACDSDDGLRAVSIRQHTSAYVSIRQRRSEGPSIKGTRVQVRGEARGEAGESKCVRE